MVGFNRRSGELVQTLSGAKLFIAFFEQQNRRDRTRC